MEKPPCGGFSLAGLSSRILSRVTIHLCGYPPPPPVGSYGRKMHGARCTAGTEFYLATGDIHAAQQLLGHADVVAIVSIESRD